MDSIEGKKVFCQAADGLKKESAQYKGMYISGLVMVLYNLNS